MRAPSSGKRCESMRPLASLQIAFLSAIAGAHDHTGATAADLPVLDEIRGDDRLSSVGRLDVYARMYCARLVEALAEDFPRLAALLGPEPFGDVAHAYFAAHPSTHPSLRWLGRHFAAFLGGSEHDVLPPCGPDLARLEWARLAVFDAPEVDPLDLDALRRVSPDAWTMLRLRLVPAVEIFAVDWPVHRIWDAIESGAALEQFGAGETHLRVWRQGDRVFQSAMDEVERAALASIAAGEAFGELCERVAKVTTAETAAATAGSLVLRWIEDGILAALPSA